MGDKGEQGKMRDRFLVVTMGNNRKMTPPNGNVKVECLYLKISSSE